MEIEEAFAHLGNRKPEGTAYIRERAEEALPHYLWMWGDKKHRMGYCTGCRQTMELSGGEPDWVMNDPYGEDHPTGEDEFDGPHRRDNWAGEPTHKKDILCPDCGRRVECRFESRGHSSLWDDVFLIEYRKSEIDPEHTVVMAGYDVIANYKGCHLGYEEQWGLIGWNTGNLDPDITINLREICVFRSAGGQEKNGAWRFIFDNWWVRNETKEGTFYEQLGGWKRRKYCVSGWVPRRGTYGEGGETVKRDLVAYEDALEGTAFEIAEEITPYDEQYIDRINTMTAIAKYPFVEYMAKMGWGYLAGQCVKGKCWNVLNEKGKTPEKILRCKRDFYAWLKGNDVEPDLEMIRTVQEAERAKLRLGYPVLVTLRKKCRIHEYSDYQNHREGMKALLHTLQGEYRNVNTEKALRYMAKNEIPARDYMDQLALIRDLKMECADEFVFPRNFGEKHAELSRRMKLTKERIHDDEITARLDGLTEYTFSALGYTMRPFVSSVEIVDEGTRQSICIGSYVERYAKGGTVICCIRRDEALNVPFAACEFSVKDGTLIQCRGNHNRRPEWTEEEEKQFWALFEDMRAQKRKQDKKRRKAA